MTRWTPEIQDVIGNALLEAQNALTGYWNLSNSDATGEHHRIAEEALEVVREAIRMGGVLEQQGIVERPRRRGIEVGDVVRLTGDHLRSTGQFTGDVPLAKGTVREIRHEGKPYALAVLEWDTPDLPEKALLTKLKKVGERERGR